MLLTWWGRLYPPPLAIQETYYVDVVNLPVPSPHSGVSAERPSVTKVAPAPPATVASSPMVTPQPLKTTSKATAKSVKSIVPQESAESEAAFEERMAKLEQQNESQHEEAVLKKLQDKFKTRRISKNGMPEAGGTETGSRYADYIKSRLEDALKSTSNYTTKNPEVVVSLTISQDGKLLNLKLERSSGDKAFELAVRRAIDLASNKFPAPPTHTVFENGFVFRPKKITNRPS